MNMMVTYMCTQHNIKADKLIKILPQVSLSFPSHHHKIHVEFVTWLLYVEPMCVVPVRVVDGRGGTSPFFLHSTAFIRHRQDENFH